MASYNKVILMGFCGKDPEVKNLENDVKVASLSIATSKRWKDKNGEDKEATQWHNLVFWKGLAGVVEKYVKKGSRIYVEGELTHRSYENEGKTFYTTEVVVSNMQMLDQKKDNPVKNPPPPEEPPQEVIESDELPF